MFFVVYPKTTSVFDNILCLIYHEEHSSRVRGLKLRNFFLNHTKLANVVINSGNVAQLTQMSIHRTLKP